MTPLPQNTLPLATTSPFTRWSHVVSRDAGDWARSFDRAARHASGWTGTGDARKSDAMQQPLPARLLRTSATGLRLSEVLHPSPVPLTCSSPEATPAFRLLATVAPRSLSVSSNEEVQPERHSVQRPRTDPSSRTPLRVHVEQDGAGLAVWLGLDRSLGSDVIAALTRSLRSSSIGGRSVTSLVCNGHTVFALPRKTKETP